MSGLNLKTAGRVLMAGKVIFNFGQSSIHLRMSCGVNSEIGTWSTTSLRAFLNREVGGTRRRDAAASADHATDYCFAPAATAVAMYFE